MNYSTENLNYMLLDYLVAQCEGVGHWNKPEKFLSRYNASMSFCRFHRDWAMTGEIIEREKIDISHDEGVWYGDMPTESAHIYLSSFADSPLVAALRCYVASKLGDTVEIPDCIHEAYQAEIEALRG